MSEKLPYDKPTEVWWHEGDERFYDASLSDGWVEAQYMLVPVDQWMAIQDELSDSVGAEAMGAIEAEWRFDQARADFLADGLELMIANCDHPDELLDDLNEFMNAYVREFFGPDLPPAFPEHIMDLIDNTLSNREEE